MKWKKKQYISFLCLLTFVAAAITGCTSSSNDTDNTAQDYSGHTLTVQVVSVEGTDVTAIIGELTEASNDTSKEAKVIRRIRQVQKKVHP